MQWEASDKIVCFPFSSEKEFISSMREKKVGVELVYVSMHACTSKITGV